MAKLTFGSLREAFGGEASDFTPLLSEQLDQIGGAIGVDLESIGETEVQTAQGRRIDIVARGDDGTQFVIENQYGRADHDHLTRGLAYAIGARARGLIVIAEEHRDEFRAVADYLNELAEIDRDGRAVAVWLVEAKAVRIGESPWAPLFTAVAEPNQFTAMVEKATPTYVPLPSLDAFYDLFEDDELRTAAGKVIGKWLALGHRRRLGPNHVVLEAKGPAKGGIRTVVTIYPNGQVLVPLGSYAGQNTGIVIEPLASQAFVEYAESVFGFTSPGPQPRTEAGWLTPALVDALIEFCARVVSEFTRHMSATDAETA